MQIEGIVLSKLKQISVSDGDIYHAIKKSDDEFFGFGEAYFSQVNFDKIKGWKLHKKMILNLVVPFGMVQFVVFDDRPTSPTRGEFFDVILSPNNYQRLTIFPGLWVSFKGVGKGLNMLLNIASIEHDPAESVVKELKEIPYDWELK